MAMNFAALFNIVNRMTDANKKEFASALNRSASVVSRDINGKNKSNPFNNDEINLCYEQVFNPENKSGLMYDKLGNNPLSELKKVIEEMNLRNCFPDEVWNMDDKKKDSNFRFAKSDSEKKKEQMKIYEKFVKAMLNRVRATNTDISYDIKITNDPILENSKPHSHNEFIAWLKERCDDFQNAINAMNELKDMEMKGYYSWSDAKIYASYHYQFALNASNIFTATKNATISSNVTALIVHDFEELMVTAEKEHSDLEDTYASTPCDDFSGDTEEDSDLEDTYASTLCDDFPGSLEYNATYTMLLNLYEHIFCCKHLDTLKLLKEERS